MISLILPTRNRPDNIQRLWQSVEDTAKGEVEACFYVDEDDTLSIPAIKKIKQKYVQGKREYLTKAWNTAATLATGDIWMQAGDDLVFKTEGWDTQVKEEFEKYPDKIVFVYGNDGYQNEDFGTHGFTHTNWVKAVGYWHPPYLDTFSDNWFNAVAKEIKRGVYLPIKTEHMHYVNGKAEKDLTYNEKAVRDARFRDLDWEHRDKRDKAVLDLKKYINEFRSNN